MSNEKTIPTADWIIKAQQKKKRKCCVCRNDRIVYLQDLLKEINAAKAFKITVQAIYDRMCDVFKDYGDHVGFHSLRRHLAHHEPLWHRSKARKS